MTEAEWLVCTVVYPMLRVIEDKAEERKLRLFACACCRRIGHLMAEEPLQHLVEISEQYGDGLASLPQLLAAFARALDLPYARREHYWAVSGSFVFGRVGDLTLALEAPDDYPLKAHRYEAVDAALWATLKVHEEDCENPNTKHQVVWQTRKAADAAASALDRDEGWYGRRLEEEAEQTTLLRHIIGNPFRPYPAPCSWSPAVVNLAKAVYNGADAGFAMHDALLESGHPDLAAHFREQEWHPKGCHVVDLILNKH
jgi:hypothetical protein